MDLVTGRYSLVVWINRGGCFSDVWDHSDIPVLSFVWKGLCGLWRRVYRTCPSLGMGGREENTRFI